MTVAPGTVLEFDYCVPPEVKLNVYLSQGARWQEVRFTCPAAGDRADANGTGAAFADVITDGRDEVEYGAHLVGLSIRYEYR